MLFSVVLVHGIDRSKSLAESALPHAPTIEASGVREVRPRLARARETILRSR
jgi:hypothetical protein